LAAKMNKKSISVMNENLIRMTVNNGYKKYNFFEK